jgi:hypothetical protein
LSKNIILVSVTAAFLLGLFIGLIITSEYKSAFNGIKWTDVASVVVNFLGFFYAFYTYHQWRSTKQKEDSYLVAKKYLSSIEQVHETLQELNLYYHQMCPAPGIIFESQDVSAQRVEHVNRVWHHLYQTTMTLVNAKRELIFWNVSLTDVFSEKHEKLVTELDCISSISFCLNSQLYHFLLMKQDNLQEVTREKEMFDQHYHIVNEITHERIIMGFEKVFKFN